MSGHNKWSKIKIKKGTEDARRSKIFSKYAKLIAIAARGNPDPDTNVTLKSVIEQARSFNMPKENVERAIKKASDKNSESLKELSLQAIAHSSVALIIDCITDNSNRTIGEIKTILNKHNAKMAEVGSLDWMFERKGAIVVVPNGNHDDFELQLIEAGAQDVIRGNDEWIVIVEPHSVAQINDKLKSNKVKIVSSEIQHVPVNPVSVDEKTEQKIADLIEELEQNDDVNDVYTNIS